MNSPGFISFWRRTVPSMFPFRKNCTQHIYFWLFLSCRHADMHPFSPSPATSVVSGKSTSKKLVKQQCPSCLGQRALDTSAILEKSLWDCHMRQTRQNSCQTLKISKGLSLKGLSKVPSYLYHPPVASCRPTATHLYPNRTAQGIQSPPRHEERLAKETTQTTHDTSNGLKLQIKATA